MPKRIKITFPNRQGHELAAALELPDTPTNVFALFAHCFTCGKDIAAASRISRALAAQNIAVLRFDFTGLGGSDGDFANANFSSNLEDLWDAADYLRTHYHAPQLLIGHSLGGTAVLNAAHNIPEARAVVTIGSPATADHVIKSFQQDLAEIAEQGVANVHLAGRAFTLKQQFIDDLRQNSVESRLPNLKKALLVFHAPQDETVSIDQAGLIFGAAKHPKSFVSLDGADHLLSKAADAKYVAATLASWAERYLEVEDLSPPQQAHTASKPARPEVAAGEILVHEANHKFLREVFSQKFQWFADEPKHVGGENIGPDPYEHLLAAVGTCTSMTIRMYANRKKWPLEDIKISLKHRRDYIADCQDCEDPDGKIEAIDRYITLTGPLDASQRQRLLEIADRCPVHRTLESDLRIKTIEVS